MFKCYLLVFTLSTCYGHLPEEDMTTVQIIEYYDYPVEEFEVTTLDDYVLKLHRIPFGKTETRNLKVPKPVIFLQHGLIASSADWVTNLPSQSAAFVFADAGFDVWMGNVRGNVYSNKKIGPHTKGDYWRFSWDEMAEYDLPAMIDSVLNITGQKGLYYVGHSQGTEIMFARLASDPNYGKKIYKFFALAPVATVSKIHGFLSYVSRYAGRDIGRLISLFGPHEFLPSNWITKLFSTIICGLKFTNPLCDNVLFQIGGPESHQFNETRLMVYMKHTPAGTSTQNMIHWIQMTQTTKMQKFDYGSTTENEKHYGQTTPPIYNLSLIQTPTYLFYSPADWLADDYDVKISIIDKINPVYLKRIKPMPDFNHFDFIWGLNARPQIYNEIIRDVKIHFKNKIQKNE